MLDIALYDCTFFFYLSLLFIICTSFDLKNIKYDMNLRT